MNLPRPQIPLPLRAFTGLFFTLALLASVAPAIGHPIDRPDFLSDADWELLGSLEEERTEILDRGKRSLARSGAKPQACGYIPTSKATTGRTYDGRRVGGPLRLDVDPYRHPRGSKERIDASILRWSTEEDSRPHYRVPGGGWCSGSRCGLGVHGLYAAGQILRFYSQRPRSERPTELSNLAANCEPSDREMVDLFATGQGWPLIERWVRDRDGDTGTGPAPSPTACPKEKVCIFLWSPARDSHVAYELPYVSQKTSTTHSQALGSGGAGDSPSLNEVFELLCRVK